MPLKSIIYALLLSISAGASADNHSARAEPVARASVEAERYMISAANPLAVEAGLKVLKAGGTAADAAVVVQTMLNLVEPQSSGIGGGAFMLYWDQSEARLVSYDGREKAPLSATPEYWLDSNGEPVGWWDAVVGGRSVGVPGTLKLLEHAHREHGKKNWRKLLIPVIVTADAGFQISPRLSASIAAAKEKKLDLFEPAKSYFFNEDGSARAAGEYLKNPDFANALRQIALHGSAPFYTGDIAQDIVDAVKTDINTGELTLQDMAAYEVKEREPVCFNYRAFEVCGMGPPTSGGLTMGQILTLLSGFDLAAMGPGPEAWHLYAEAAKLAYADRGMYMADADFVDMPTEGLLDPEYLAERAKLIQTDVAMEKAEAGSPPEKSAERWSPDTQPERAGTSHFVIVDQYGDMISMTTTIETGFGSRVMTNGFLLNNELTDFSRKPEKDGQPIANRVEAGKRPRSSMSPTIVLKNGKPVLLTGSPGGSRIINYVTQSVIAMLDWQMAPQAALDMPHVVNRNGTTELEQNTAATELAPALEALGHKIKIRELNSGLHAILLKEGKLIGGADSRREGIAAGE